MESHTIPSESRRKHLLAAIGAPFLWGFMTISVRWIKEYPSEDILYYRVLTAFVILWLFILIFRRKALAADMQTFLQLPSKRKVVLVTLCSAILISANWFTYIYAVNHISIQAAGFAYLVCPLLTAISAYIFLKEQLTRTQKIALAFAVISVCMLANGAVIDTLWSICIGLCFALYLILQRYIPTFDKLNLLAVQLSVCSLFIIPSLVLSNHDIPEATFFWIDIIIIATVFTIIPLFLSMYALTRISSTTTGVLLYINPLIVFILAVFFFKEPVTPYKWGAYGIIILAIILFNWETIKRYSPSTSK